MDIAAVTVNYLLYVVMPLWLVVGVADWLCHRATHIETTSGVKEPLLLCSCWPRSASVSCSGFSWRSTPSSFAVMIVCFVAHEITAHWDRHYAADRRKITAIEQHVHNYLGALPFMGLSFVVVLHWPQALSLLGLGPHAAEFSIRLKSSPLPVAYVVTLIVLIAVFEVLPYLEEFWRGLASRCRLGPEKPRAG